MRKVVFAGKILVIGAGGVSRCVLPLLLKHLSMPSENITVIDMTDCREALSTVLVEGVQFIRDRITQEGYAEQLSKYVVPGDMIIDLAWNIDTVALLTWCHEHGVTYVNTSTELWDPYQKTSKVTDRTLYVRHMEIRKMIAGWGKVKGPTAILEHGANPGLVSHFTKMGLLDIAKKVLGKKGKNGNGHGDAVANGNGAQKEAIARAAESQSFNVLAQLLGVKVIHISEIDTQITSEPNTYDEFLNTWSVEGFFEEGTSPAEMGWGTHEQVLPPDAHQHETGPKNQICLSRFGINTFVRSRVPSDEILGMVVRHGEAFTMSDALTVWDKDKAIYRPTVHYAYSPCLAAVASLHALRANHYKMQGKFRIMNDDIVSGVDELGVLIMGHEFKSWWTGSILGIDEANKLVPNQNATTLQVAAAVLAAVIWMIKNPKEGVLVPDQLPHTEILKVAAPYLGDVVSIPLDWYPNDFNAVEPSEQGAQFVNDASAWQFNRFLWKF